ncbi:hypothetical protein EV122DRAFT_225423 [Schizophyllum commune]
MGDVEVTGMRSADAARAKARRERLAIEDPARLEQERQAKAAHARSLRRAQAEAAGRIYRPRNKAQASVRDLLDSHVNHSTSTPLPTSLGPGHPPEEVSWNPDMLKDLGMSAGTLLPRDLVHRLEVLGSTIHTWRLSLPLPDQVLQSHPRGSASIMPQQFGYAYRRLSSGSYSDYNALRQELKLLGSCLRAADSFATLFESARRACPPRHLQTLYDYELGHVTWVRTLQGALDGIEEARLSFMKVAPAAFVEAILGEAVDCAVAQEYTVKTPYSSSYALNCDDLSRLGPDCWLNDAVIDFMLALWTGEHLSEDIIFMPTSFASLHFDLTASCQLRGGRRAYSHGWLKEAAVGRAYVWRKIVFPVAHKNHFFAVVIDTADTTVTTYDSLKSISWRGNHLDSFVTAVQEWVIGLCNHHGWQPPSDTWIGDCAQRTPQQINQSDCGIFTLLFLRHLSMSDRINGDDVPAFYRLTTIHNAVPMDWARLLLLEEILEKGSLSLP